MNASHGGQHRCRELQRLVDGLRIHVVACIAHLVPLWVIRWFNKLASVRVAIAREAAIVRAMAIARPLRDRQTWDIALHLLRHHLGAGEIESHSDGPGVHGIVANHIQVDEELHTRIWLTTCSHERLRIVRRADEPRFLAVEEHQPNLGFVHVMGHRARQHRAAQ